MENIRNVCGEGCGKPAVLFVRIGKNNFLTYCSDCATKNINKIMRDVQIFGE